MSERSIFVTLGLKADNFKRESEAAAQSLGKVSAAGDKAATTGAKGFRGMAQEIRDNEQHMRTLGVGLVGVGAAMLGVTAAVAKTGIEYNTLQQQSRAALRVLVGGAEAANAQMDKLDAFARTSPFSKATFIQAQQQMLGFGIEAQKVVPYLSSIQDATAAIGGSNNEISQIVDVFAKIQSQGKITARELMQLGIHGIDAATLIGDAMGKTATQIRDEITAGTLDAEAALDALSQGMDARFGGAAAAVKDTMVGAADRVKAAWRDMSASMMEPFVSQQGGGWLVDWTNRLADLMRTVDKLPQGAKTAGVVITGVAGAASIAAGSFLLLTPRIIAMGDAMAALSAKGGVFGTMARGLGLLKGAAGPAAMAVAAIGVGFAAWASHEANVRARIDSYAAALDNLAGSSMSVEQALARQAAQTAVTGDQQAWNWLTTAASGFNDMQAVMAKAGVTASEWGTAVGYGGDQLAALKDKLLAAHAAGDLTLWQWIALDGALDEAATAAAAAGTQFHDTAAAEKELEVGAEGAADGLSAAAEAASAAADQLDTYRAALQNLVTLSDSLADSFVAGREAERAYAETMAEFTGATVQSEAALDAFGKTQRDQIATMIAAVDANGQRVYSEEMLTAKMRESRAAVVDAGVALGMTSVEANVLADNLGLIPEEVSIRVAAQNEASDEVHRILGELDGIPPEVITQIMAMDNSTGVAEAVRSAIEDGIPVEWITNLLATDNSTRVSKPVDQAIRDIPRDWNTMLTAKDNSSRYSKMAASAVRAIPTSRTTHLKAVDGISGIVRAAQAAINSLKGKTVTVTTRHTSSGDTSGGRQVKAAGGAVFGPGTGTSDEIPVWLSNSEHVVTAAEVASFGGHGNVYALRSVMKSRPDDLRRALGLAGGGTPSVVPHMVPVPAPQGQPSPQLVLAGDMEITGTLRHDGDGLMRIIDGRIVRWVPRG